MRFAHIRFRESNGTIRAVYLKYVTENGAFLRGIEVNRDGEEIHGRDFDQRLRVIQRECIVSQREYIEDRTYGTLVPKEVP